MKKSINFFLALSMILGTVASTQAIEITNSIGSVKEDINKTENVTGKDDVQGQKSEYKEAETENNATNVYLTKVSTYTVTIPKTVILDGETDSGNYAIKVEGNLSGTEVINVVPDTTFVMSQDGKDDITATVEQDKTEWKFDEMNITGVGTIQAINATAGSWNGSFNFNIGLERRARITVTSKNENGEDLNATATEIKGEEKDTLLTSLEQTGMITSKDDVDALIEVNSDEFEGMADTTFDVSSIAEEGDKVAILHFDTTKQEWEYIGTETVDSEGKISADFSSYSPVVFVKVNDIGNYEDIILEAGLYDASGTMIASWEESGIDVEIDYGNSSSAENYYKTTETAGFYVLNKPEYTSVTKIVIPQSVTSIGDYAFYDCKNLTSVIIPSSVKDIGFATFLDCTGLTSIGTITSDASIKMSNSVTTIGNYAFKGSGLINVNIPDGVNKIGGNVFESCKSLINIKMSNSVTSIGGSAFNGCTNLIEIEISESVTSIENKIFYNCTSLINIEIPDSVTKIGDSAFAGCTNLASIIIPENVINIGNNAFSRCSSLTSVKIPNNVKNIKQFVFEDCTGLSSIEIEDGLASIGHGTFEGCTGLTSIKIPNSVISIGQYVFKDCTNLKDLTMPISAKINSGAFTNVTNLENITLTAGNGVGADYWWENTAAYTPWYQSRDNEPTIILEEGITYIGDYTFYDNYSIKTLIIPNSVIEIGRGAFEASINLTNINWSDTEIIIDDWAFAGCTSLKTLIIPSTIKEIGVYTFSYCENLTNLTIESGVTKLGDDMFNSCTSLSTVRIPSSVCYMGYGVFLNTGLSKAIFEDKTTWYTTPDGGNTVQINSSDLSNSSTAATYLTNNYVYYIWEKE